MLSTLKQKGVCGQMKIVTMRKEQECIQKNKLRKTLQHELTPLK